MLGAVFNPAMLMPGARKKKAQAEDADDDDDEDSAAATGAEQAEQAPRAIASESLEVTATRAAGPRARRAPTRKK